jgi:hypothetical protein
LVVKAQLHGLVTVRLDRFALKHAVRPGQHDRNGNYIPLRVVNAGLAKFFSE